MKKFFLLFLLLTVNIATVASGITPNTTSIVPPKSDILLLKESDIVIGCNEAKHIIIEYSSLACPHCAKYYNEVFPKIKSEIINKCKAKYVYRDFPTTRSALEGVATARCISTNDSGKINSEEFFRLIQLLFNSQATWAFTSSYRDQLGKILSITGLPQEKISKCMENRELMEEIVSNAFISMKALNMSHSPSIFIDGVELPVTDFESINTAVSK
jgi:protein-disulfide isomerase